MKRAILIGVLIIFGMAVGAQASTPKLGVGVILGAPTGITGKLWIAEGSAIDAAIGWNFEEQAADIQAGYLFHFPMSVSSGFLAPYIGAGLWAELAPPSENPDVVPLTLAGRASLGLEYKYKSFGFFAELNPLVVFYPEGIGLDFGGGLGARFYF